MASSWSGRVYAIRGDDGKYHVGITLPTGMIAASRLSVFDGTGPYPPTGFPGTIAVDDLDAWSAEQRKAGITLTPGTM
jgi:hypothetical protein